MAIFHISNSTNYSPFGVELYERGFTIDDYRYGYQGSEKDNEVKGNGNSYTTYFRQLDPRLGRWLSIDPKASSMPWQSPYCSMDNNPIYYNDALGDKVKIGAKGKKKREIKKAIKADRKASSDFDDKFKEQKKDKNILYTYRDNTKFGTVNGEDRKIKRGTSPMSATVIDKVNNKSGLDRVNVVYNSKPPYEASAGIFGLFDQEMTPVYSGNEDKNELSLQKVAGNITKAREFGAGERVELIITVSGRTQLRTQRADQVVRQVRRAGFKVKKVTVEESKDKGVLNLSIFNY